MTAAMLHDVYGTEPSARPLQAPLSEMPGQQWAAKPVWYPWTESEGVAMLGFSN
jgi:hypothetical protein